MEPNRVGKALRRRQLDQGVGLVLEPVRLCALALHAGPLYLAPTQFVLRVEPIDLETWVAIVAVSTSVLVVNELHKLLRRPFRPPTDEPRPIRTGG